MEKIQGFGLKNLNFYLKNERLWRLKKKTRSPNHGRKIFLGF